MSDRDKVPTWWMGGSTTTLLWFTWSWLIVALLCLLQVALNFDLSEPFFWYGSGQFIVALVLCGLNFMTRRAKLRHGDPDNSRTT